MDGQEWDGETKRREVTSGCSGLDCVIKSWGPVGALGEIQGTDVALILVGGPWTSHLIFLGFTTYYAVIMKHFPLSNPQEYWKQAN